MIKNIFAYDLYKNNPERFHHWLKQKRHAILGSLWTWTIGWITGILLAVSLFVMMHNSQEISETEYRSLIQDEERYSEQYPEWKVMLEAAMEDGVVNEGENTDMRRYLIARWEEKAEIAKIKTKAKLIKQMK